MPVKISGIDNGEDVEIIPGKRDSDRSDIHTINDTRLRVTDSVKSAPALPEVYDLTQVTKNLHTTGKITYVYDKGVKNDERLARTLKNLPHGFAERLNLAISNALKVYIFDPFGRFDEHIIGRNNPAKHLFNTLGGFDKQMKSLNGIAKVTVVLNEDSTINGIWFDLDQTDSAQNDNRYAGGSGVRKRKNAKVQKIPLKDMN